MSGTPPPPPQSSAWAFRPEDLPEPELLARDPQLANLEHNPIFRFKRYALRAARPRALASLLPFNLPRPLLAEFLLAPGDPEMIVAGLWGYSLSLRGASPFRIMTHAAPPTTLAGRIRLRIARIVGTGCVVIIAAALAAMGLSFFSGLWAISGGVRMGILGVALLGVLPGCVQLRARGSDRAATALLSIGGQMEGARIATSKRLGRGPLFPPVPGRSLELSVMSAPSMLRPGCATALLLLGGIACAFAVHRYFGSDELLLLALALSPLSALSCLSNHKAGLAYAASCRLHVPKFWDYAVKEVREHLALLNEEDALARLDEYVGPAAIELLANRCGSKRS